MARKQDMLSGGKVARSGHEFARFFRMHITKTFCIRQQFGAGGADWSTNCGVWASGILA